MNELSGGVAIRACGFTHVGARSHNEDCFLVNENIGLMVVADGVGGHQAGEVASAITCEVLEREVAGGATLEQGILVANTEVFEAVAQELGRAGMASTVVALHLEGADWSLAWVGDSRAYLWDGTLGLLSRDHSLVEDMVQSGQISLEEARSHPQKNIISQAVGLRSSDQLSIGRNAGQLRDGQVLLLCSDGLNDVLDSADIARILSSGQPLESRCEQLVLAAVGAGGRDNTTVLLLELVTGGPQRGDAAQPEFNWLYDPVERQYSGLPELSPVEGSENELNDLPQGTLLMKSPFELVNPAQQSPVELGGGGEGATPLRYLWAALLVTVLALLVGLVL